MFKSLLWKIRTYFGIIWWNITLFLSKKENTLTPPYKYVDDIADALQGGTLYKYDALKGKTDWMQHPTRTQKNLNMRVPIGDCEDHALYWAYTLYQNEFASKIYLGFFNFKYRDSKNKGAHAICIWKPSLSDDKYMWADYHLPNEISDPEIAFYESAESYKADLLNASLIPIQININTKTVKILSKDIKFYHNHLEF